MVKYVCDDQRVEKLLERLGNEVTKLGGKVHESTEIRCEDGNLSMHSTASTAYKGPLISLPEQALLPVDEVEFTIRDDELRLASPPSHLSTERRRLLDTMLEIYGQTRKIPVHGATSPWLALTDAPRILEQLVRGRETAPAVKTFYADCRAGDYNRLAWRSFIKTRTLAFKTTPDDSAAVLMPLIDFVNHHPRCPRFARWADSSGRQWLAVLKAQSGPASTECFVLYGIYDSLDAYLVYGFVDESAPFVRSVPLKIELGRIGTIEVHSLMGAKKHSGKLPPHLDAVRQFMPGVKLVGDKHIVLTHLLIPAGPPIFALRRILQEIIAAMCPELDQFALQNNVENAESQLISVNIAFYEELLCLLVPNHGVSCDRPPVSTVKRLAEVQLNKLKEYRQMVRTCNG